jgi:zinc transport system substrate-binding protein
MTLIAIIMFLKTAVLVVITTLSLAFPVSAKPMKVLASIHPLGLIAASVTPLENLEVLVPEGITPHDFSLRPSDIDRLQEADVILWSGRQAEPYLAGFARRWPDKTWIDLSSFALEGQVRDPHYWLSVPISLKAQQALAEALGVTSDDFSRQVERVVVYSDEVLAPVKDRGFFVFHRAYDHWVNERGLNQVGAFTLTPEQKPGMRTLQLMRDQLRGGDVACVFREPEYSPALVVKVVGDLRVKQGELDPLGTHISLSKDGYPYFLRDMADRAVNCLKK